MFGESLPYISLPAVLNFFDLQAQISKSTSVTATADCRLRSSELEDSPTLLASTFFNLPVSVFATVEFLDYHVKTIGQEIRNFALIFAFACELRIIRVLRNKYCILCAISIVRVQ